MRKLIAALLLFAAIPCVGAEANGEYILNPFTGKMDYYIGHFGSKTDYYGITQDTSAGTAAMAISGTLSVAASSLTPTTFPIVIDGSDGSVTATSFAGDGASLTGLAIAGQALSDGKVWIGNGSNLAAAQTAIGDVSLTNGGVFTVVGLNKGSIAAASAITMTDNYIPAVVNLESQTNPGAEYTLGAIYGKAASKAGTDMTNVQLVGVLARAAMNSDVLDAYATQSHLTIAANATSSGNMTAISGKTVLADSVATGIVTAGLFTLEGPVGAAVSPNTAYGLWADIVDTNIAAGLMIHANGSTIASGVSFAKTGTGAFTKEITMQNGETIDNATDGTIAVGGALSVTGATKMAKKTIAELQAITPAVGDTYICTDCSVPYSIAVGTVAAAGGFGVSALTTFE